MNPSAADALFQRYMEGTLSDEDSRELREGLKHPSFRRRWRELTELEGALAERFSKRNKASQPRRSRIAWFSNFRSAAAALIVLGLGTGLLVLFGSLDTHRSVAATVVFTHSMEDSSELSKREGSAIYLNEWLDVPANSGMGLRFSNDGSLLQIGSGSRVKITEEGARRYIHLASGQAMATVPAQPPGHSTYLVTPHARASVQNTQVSLEVAQEGSSVDVREGRITIEDRISNQSALVGGGEHLVVNNKSPLEVKKTRKTPTSELVRVFSVDFSTGKPANWNRGDWVETVDQDRKSGAVVNVATWPGASNAYALSAQPSRKGYFSVTNDTTIGARLKLDEPGRILVFAMLGSKEKAFVSNMLFEFDSTSSNWQTLEIPLWRFFALNGGCGSTDLARENELFCTKIWFEVCGPKNKNLQLSGLWADEPGKTSQ